MKRSMIIIIGFMVILIGGILLLGYLRQAREKETGTWVCKNGQWVSEGEPKIPKPTWECREGEKIGGGGGNVYDQTKFERSQKLAQETVANSSTYKFDGVNLKLDSSETLDCSNCWRFNYSFSSRHPGYGDRTGQFLAQVITPHQVSVTIQEEKVLVIVTDQTFDEISQRYLK